MMKVRRAARAVVLNELLQVLLLRYHDESPIDPRRPDTVSYWVPPGGGIVEGESALEAARRELLEETGIEAIRPGRLIWIRERQLMHKGELKLYHESYFEFRHHGAAPLRNATCEKILEHRWWGLDQIRGSSDTFFPPRLDGHLQALVAATPQSYPLRIEG